MASGQQPEIGQIFISYQREDVAFARELREHIHQLGPHTWMDLYDIPAGAYWPDEIDRGLAASDIVIGILSTASVASRNVKNEWDWALGNDRQLILLLIEPCDIPHRYYALNYVNFTGDWQRAFGELASALGPGPAETSTAGLVDGDIARAMPQVGPLPRRVRETPEMFGREHELDRLRGLLDQAVEGSGSLVLVGGEAGIGKTTLTTALAVEAEQQDMLVLSGGCYDLMTTPPYGPWVEVARSYVPDGDDLPSLPPALTRGEGLQGISSQTALFELVVSFLSDVATRRPILLLLEDLHWSDIESLHLLRYVGRILAGQRMLVVVTYREDELTRRHQLYQLLPVLVRESNAERVNLRRLDETGIRQILASRYELSADDEGRLIDYLGSHSEGNPFFIKELLHALEEDQVLRQGGQTWRLGQLDRAGVPPLVRQVIDHRLNHLDGAIRSLLEVAAIIGQDVPIDLWSAVADVSDEAFVETIEQGSSAHLLQENPAGTGVRFTHALIRETLYEEVVLPRRRIWHRKIADVLLKAPEPDPDIVAYHLYQASDERAAEWLIRSGKFAEQLHAWRTAADQFGLAEQLLVGQPDTLEERGWLLFRIGRLLRFSDAQQSLAYLEQAAEIGEEIDELVLVGYSLLAGGVARCNGGDLHRGIEQLETAAAVFNTVEERKPTTTSVTVEDLIQSKYDDVVYPDTFGSNRLIWGANPASGPLSGWLIQAGRYRDSVAISEKTISHLAGESIDDDENRAAVLTVCSGYGGALAMLGDPERGEQLIKRAQHFFRRIGHRPLESISLLSQFRLIVVPYQTDQVDKRRDLARETVAVRKSAGEAVEQRDLLPDGPDRHYFLEGQWREARHQASVFLDSTDYNWRNRAIGTLVMLARDQGVPDEAWSLIDALLPEGPQTEPGDSQFTAILELQRIAAELALDEDDLETAREWIEAHDRWMAWSEAVLGLAEGQLLWARYHLVAGSLDLARKHAGKALAHASDPRQPLALIAVHRFLGEMDTKTSDLADARRHLDESLQLAEICELPFERALTLIAQAELLVTAGDISQAESVLDQAREICEELEATPSLERIDALIARL